MKRGFLSKGSIGFRIAVPLIIFYILVSLVILLVLKSFTSKIYRDSFTKGAKKSEEQIFGYIASSSQVAMNIATTLSRFPSVVKTYKLYKDFVEESGVSRDEAIKRVRAFLLMNMGSILNSVKSPFSPESSLMLRFYLSDGRVLYSTWKDPRKEGAVPFAACMGRKVMGLDSEGSFLFVMAASPVVGEKKECLGAVECIFPLKDIAGGMELSKGEFLSFYTVGGSGSKAVFKEVFEFPKGGAKELIKEDLLKKAVKGRFFKDFGSRYVCFFPLKGEGGKVVGVGVYGLDISPYLKEIGKSMVVVGIVVSAFFVVMVSLLILLVRTITSPINSMVSVVDTLVDEGVGKGVRVESSGCDEIDRLSEAINRLLEHTEELTLFKRVIEEDESLEDVYRRMSRLLRDRFGVDEFVIYEVNNSKNYMRVVGEGGEGPWCDKDILTEANLCRAKRTASVVSSLLIPDICPRFRGDGLHHVCIPVYMGEQVGMVVQIVGNRDRIASVEERLGRLKLYLKECSPVISSKRLLSALKESTTRDPLTGLFNRRFLEDYLETAVSSALRRKTFLGILMMDIDHFKEVNDKYGHETGDVVLKEITKAISSAVRKSDVLVRFGGEEFLLVLDDVKPEYAVDVAEKVRKKVEMLKIPAPGGVVLRKTISIGVSIFPLDSEDIWECVKFSDIALYKAKNLGRNRVVRFERGFIQEEPGEPENLEDKVSLLSTK